MEKVHEDKRGVISILKIGKKEYLVMTTKKGFSRGGEIHDRNQYLVVLQGTIEVTLYNGNLHSESDLLHEGEMILIPIGTPHFITAVIDSIILEWKGQKWNSKEAKKMAKFYRNIVESKMK